MTSGRYWLFMASRMLNECPSLLISLAQQRNALGGANLVMWRPVRSWSWFSMKLLHTFVAVTNLRLSPALYKQRSTLARFCGSFLEKR